MLGVELEDPPLGRRVPAVGPDRRLDRCPLAAIGKPDPRSHPEEKLRARHAQGIGRPAEGVVRRRRPAQHLVQHRGGAHSALEHRAVDRRLEITRAQVVQQPDDPVASEIGGVAHRRPPVPVADAGVLGEEIGMGRDQAANAVEVVVPDGVDQLAALHHPGPTGGAVGPRQRMLRVGQLRSLRYDAWMPLGGRVPPPRRSPRRNARSRSLAWCLSWVRSGRTGRRRTGITSLLWRPRSAGPGEGGSWDSNSSSCALRRWTRSFPRTGGVLHACDQSTGGVAGRQEGQWDSGSVGQWVSGTGRGQGGRRAGGQGKGVRGLGI